MIARPTHRPTKAEAKLARAEAARAAAARARRRSRNIRIGLWSAAGLAVLALVVTMGMVLSRPDTPKAGNATPTPAASTSGRTSNPPWSAPANASAAVAAAGLPMLGEEGTALHIHAHLDVIVNGTPVQVPADIGVDDAQQKISPLHSHDTTGVIHIESPNKNDTFTLGQFFTEWDVSLSANHLGGLTADNTHHLVVYVNGTPRTGNPAGLVLAAHDEIAIVYSTDAQQTNVPQLVPLDQRPVTTRRAAHRPAPPTRHTDHRSPLTEALRPREPGCRPFCSSPHTRLSLSYVLDHYGLLADDPRITWAITRAPDEYSAGVDPIIELTGRLFARVSPPGSCWL